jgi:hypothetical protein
LLSLDGSVGSCKSVRGGNPTNFCKAGAINVKFILITALNTEEENKTCIDENKFIAFFIIQVYISAHK